MFTSIRANPFLQWELRQGIRSSKINWSFVWLRVIPLSFLTLVGLIPVFYFIDDSRVDWLPWMAIVLFMPRPILAIRTIFIGIQNVRQDMIQRRWEPLILTGMPARKIVWNKWTNIVHKSLPDQVLFTLPTIGLALGISQFFQATHFCNKEMYNGPYLDHVLVIKSLFSSYCYNGVPSFSWGYLNPSSIGFLIGIIFIIIIGCFETGLNASLGLTAGLSRLSLNGLRIIYGSIIRFSLLVVIFFSIPLIPDYFNNNLICDRLMFINPNICEISDNRVRILRKTYDTIGIAVMPLLDQGTLLAANVMRPSDGRWQDRNLPITSTSEATIHINAYDTRPIVLRNIIAAMISGFFYWLLIRHFLRRATQLAIVNHGASGYLEL